MFAMVTCCCSRPPILRPHSGSLCDPCHAVGRSGAEAMRGPALRMLPAICCVVLGGFGAAALVWTATANSAARNVITGSRRGCRHRGGGGRRSARPRRPVVVRTAESCRRDLRGGGGLSRRAARSTGIRPTDGIRGAFSASIVLLRLIGCGTTLLTAIATLSVLTAAVAAAGVTWAWHLRAGGAALASVSLAALGFAPRIAMVLSGAGPRHRTPTIRRPT